jgi:hypothetical protein
VASEVWPVTAAAKRWQFHIAGWARSGLSCKEYAAQVGVHPGTLAAWKSLRRAQAQRQRSSRSRNNLRSWPSPTPAGSSWSSVARCFVCGPGRGRALTRVLDVIHDPVDSARSPGHAASFDGLALATRQVLGRTSGGARCQFANRRDRRAGCWGRRRLQPAVPATASALFQLPKPDDLRSVVIDRRASRAHPRRADDGGARQPALDRPVSKSLRGGGVPLSSIARQGAMITSSAWAEQYRKLYMDLLERAPLRRIVTGKKASDS